VERRKEKEDRQGDRIVSCEYAKAQSHNHVDRIGKACNQTPFEPVRYPSGERRQ